LREIGLVTHRHFVKEKLMEVLKEEILLNIPNEMKHGKKKEVIDI